MALRFSVFNHQTSRFFIPGLTLAALLFYQCNTQTPADTDSGATASATLLSSLTATPKTIGLGGSARIMAVVVDENASPVSGKVVLFSASRGTITPADTTDGSGIAEAIYLGPQIPGPVTITARLGSQIDSTTVTIDTQISQNLQILPEQKSILANGFSTVKLLIQAWDTNQQPVPNARIDLTSSAGAITPTVYTDNNGTAEAVLQSIASQKDVAATIKASLNDIEAVSLVIFRGVNFQLQVTPTTLIADGRSQATVQAILKETTRLVAVPQAEIHFGASLGTIPNAVLTNESGVAKTLFTSSVDTGAAMIIASYGEFIHDTVRVTIGQSVPTYLNLSATPPVLIADNRSQAEIKAVVSDAANNPVPDGTPVYFEIIQGSGTLESRKVTQSGTAISILTSSRTPDSVWVRASVGNLQDTVLVRYVVGPPARIHLTSSRRDIPADGSTKTRIQAYVYDEVGNPVKDGTRVSFSSDIGEITSTAETRNGVAEAEFSSNVTGLATITAAAGQATGTLTVRALPGPPNSVLLSYDPASVGVKDSGRNTTLTITADIRDARNNPVADPTYVKFSIVSSPGGGEFLSSDLPIPTINGKAQVSFNAGIRSGTARIRAEVTDSTGRPLNPPVSAVSTEIIIFAGPPYMADVNDLSTSHLSVGAEPLNILGWHFVNNTATIVALIGDKYNNPVPAGTAVYFTTTGGIIATHTGYTDENGVATVTLHSGQPYPTVPRYYNTFFDPNAGHPNFSLPTSIIPGPIPDYDLGEVANGYDATSQNNGIARVLAVTEGVDQNGNPARVWNVANVIFSGLISVFRAEVDKTQLLPGEAATIIITIYDENGNPIVPGSSITLEADAGKLSWTELVTSDPGKTKYVVALTNNLDPNDPNAKETTVSVGIKVTSKNGNDVISTPPIQLKLR
ncbi:MAG: Ig-like domain-containing protein [candidate division KSB1 bacterium]|nr:Ig-like domain-containing protein [candidate division KSB1 bacterium]